MKMTNFWAAALATACITACSGDASMNDSLSANAANSDPFARPSALDYHFPPFDQIRDEHYEPAFEQGMADHRAEIELIVSNPEPATFENTLVAMELSGQLLSRVASVFYGLSSAHTNDEIEAIQARIAPKLAAHQDAITLDPRLFARINTLYAERESLGLDAESMRLLTETHRDFVRAGALLSDTEKDRMKAINSEMAELQTAFSQNVLAEVNASAVIVDDVARLAGLSNGEIAAAAEAAEARGLENQWVIPLLNTSGQPALSSLKDRALREEIHRASLARGSSGGDHDNRDIIAQLVKLRAERAQLLGYATHAAFNLDQQTAKTQEAVNNRLYGLAPAAVANARREGDALQTVIDARGDDITLEAWDWQYYTEILRREQYNFDESELRPYFELDNVLIKGVFFAAEQIYGITFKERPDLPRYHPDTRVWEVFNEDGSRLALFIEDMYARPSKRGGAWARAYVSQNHLEGNLPVVANHLNIPKPPEGEPTLLTWDEVNTMFHEFGHALHGMFSNVTYPSFAGTSVPRDFVEYPSQVNEMWADWPEVLANYAVHYETGEPLPQELLDKVMATAQFNEGFRTTEYLAAAVLDQVWHQQTLDALPDGDGVLDFEAQALAGAGFDFAPVPPRYRTTYFSHIIGGYSAGYYSYIWSEVLDADTVEWFKENGGMTRENGQHFRDTLLSRGGSEEAMQLYRDFRGRDAELEPLLRRRGLTLTE
jgi:peptidyl-dipeptidase Dcp